MTIISGDIWRAVWAKKAMAETSSIVCGLVFCRLRTHKPYQKLSSWPWEFWEHEYNTDYCILIFLCTFGLWALIIIRLLYQNWVLYIFTLPGYRHQGNSLNHFQLVRSKRFLNNFKIHRKLSRKPRIFLEISELYFQSLLNINLTWRYDPDRQNSQINSRLSLRNPRICSEITEFFKSWPAGKILMGSAWQVCSHRSVVCAATLENMKFL